ncbi:4-oxalocrotonate tautomerase [Salinisphaera shabanensis T35B1]|uniref:tautomerase family protein n=1 Tax=Salinisphaera shabanensis TaxID=180542 RepID=UPI0033407CC6
MPHINLKIAAGQSEVVKRALADAFVASLVEIAGADPELISVAIEDIAPRDWARDVYDREIGPRPDTLYRQPGYNPGQLPR